MKGDKRFFIVEGVTCAGKTTVLRAIQNVFGKNCLLEVPPLNGIADNPHGFTFYAHQEHVFNSFIHQFRSCPDGVWYVDYSPFGCIPFTKAVIDMGYCDDCESLIPQMVSACNALCKYADCVLHRYLEADLDTIRHRLRDRDRKGDDAWSILFLDKLIQRYDEFFKQDLILKGEGHILGIRDGAERYLTLPLDGGKCTCGCDCGL